MDRFTQTVSRYGSEALLSLTLETLQVNVGLRCNMSCNHCHQASGPWRTESMQDDVLDAVISFAEHTRPQLVDVTGGAPELHPRIRDLVSRLTRAGLTVQVRTNLTALLEPGSEDLATFFAAQRVRVLASLPSLQEAEYVEQRGAAIGRAIEALWRLNAVGYATEPDLDLVLAVNPAFLAGPGDTDLDRDKWRVQLVERYNVRFTDAILIDNMPLGRLGARLGTADSQDLIAAARSRFNAGTLPLLGCRRGLEIAWDGGFADCDFNLAAGIRVFPGSDDAPTCVTSLMRLGIDDPSGFDRALAALIRRRINYADHCFICTAACGSS